MTLTLLPDAHRRRESSRSTLAKPLGCAKKKLLHGAPERFNGIPVRVVAD
jgi:hypothetical protein